MPRNMSFAMTKQQMRDGIKSVTRRFGWKFLQPGQIVWAVEKAMGLQKGEKIKRICAIRIISTRNEPLNAIDQADVIREGFPDWTPQQFINMLVRHHKVDPLKIVNRIEFEIVGWIQ